MLGRSNSIDAGGFLPVVAATALLFLSLAGPASADGPIDARVGELTERFPGMPATDVEARQLVSASVRQDLLKKRLSGSFTLRATPTKETDAALVVEFGFLNNGRCQGDPDSLQVTSTFEPTGGFQREGRVFTLDKAHDEAAWQTWNCAMAIVATKEAPVTTFDGLGGFLRDIDAKPQLRLGKPTLLGEADQPIELVRGVWTVLELQVFNDGRVPAKGVEISGGGDGMTVKPLKVGKVFEGGNELARVEVKLSGGGEAKLKLKAKSGPITASTSVRVKAIDAPPRPLEGKYESSDGRISFRVEKGEIRQWRGERLQMRCAPPFEIPTYRTVTLNFPDTEIPRNGVVDAVKKYEEGDVWYTAWLSMRIAKAKATDGEFTYVTAGSCRVSVDFSAKRTGN